MFLTRSVIIALILGCGCVPAATPQEVRTPAGQGTVWLDSLKDGLSQARKSKRAVVLLFTMGEACPSCRALATEVFESDAWKLKRAQCYVPVKVRYRRRNQPEQQVLVATARLQVYPTLYLLDDAGWPFLVRGGFRVGEGPAVIKALDDAKSRAARPKDWRERGVPGFRKLLTWYRKRDLRFGETLALAALFPHGAIAEKLTWAPSLLAVATAREGALVSQPYLGLLEEHDPVGARGHLSRGLLLAGRQLLGLGRDGAASKVFQRALDLSKAAPAARLEAAVYLAHVYSRIDAPCLVHHHLKDALARWGETPGADAATWITHARKRLEGATPCAGSGCDCSKKRVK